MGGRREGGAIEAYRADGWRGASRDRVRPNAALNLATMQARRHTAALCSLRRTATGRVCCSSFRAGWQTCFLQSVPARMGCQGWIHSGGCGRPGDAIIPAFQKLLDVKRLRSPRIHFEYLDLEMVAEAEASLVGGVSRTAYAARLGAADCGCACPGTCAGRTVQGGDPGCCEGDRGGGGGCAPFPLTPLTATAAWARSTSSAPHARSTSPRRCLPRPPPPPPPFSLSSPLLPEVAKRSSTTMKSVLKRWCASGQCWCEARTLPGKWHFMAGLRF